MKKFDKIVAIADSPLDDEIRGNIKRLNLGVDLERAYKKGDVFEVLSTFDKDYVVYHPIIKTSMSVRMDDFMTLSEWREGRLNELGI